MKGRVIDWNDDKGFGFLRTAELPNDVFFHIKDVKDKRHDIAVGRKADFEVTKGRDGKSRAIKVRLQAPALSWVFSVPVIATILAPFIGAALVFNRYPYLLLIALLVSVITFYLFRWDKRQAQINGRRVAEFQLHLWELMGGWPGSLLAQRLYRHKIRKRSYQVKYWLMVSLHVCLYLEMAWHQSQWLYQIPGAQAFIKLLIRGGDALTNIVGPLLAW
jgi:uncharacterized membrane protein YsdA (DUF1294 family)/cold shock CspA family protein